MPRILVIDSSSSSRRLLRQVLEADRDITIVQELDELTQTLRAVLEVTPDLVTIDAAALSAGGLLAIERIMSEAPLPIVVMAELARDPGDESLEHAMRRGALAIRVKPTLSDVDGAALLRAEMRQLAKVPVVRHQRSRPAAYFPSAPSGASAAAAGRLSHLPASAEVIGIGCSAGGPAALAEILAALPKGFPACVLVVQHLPVGFAEPFAGFLRARIALPVAVMKDSRPLTPGQVILAPDGAHLCITSRGQGGTSSGPPVGGHRPSVDVLFESLARFYGALSIGVILSGIGSDGTAGLLAIREHGGLTIAQDAQSAAVNGMPRSANESGAAGLCLAPAAIAQELRRVCAGRAKAGGQHGS